MNLPALVIVLMVNKFRKELQRFTGALTFYSRIPLPTHWFSAETSPSSRYFSLVGWIVGAVSVSVWMLAQMLISGSLIGQSSSEGPEPIAVLLGLTVGILLTGALHEDGFADTCDGFGHGGTPEEKLRIMKDSRIGTYGALGILLLVLLKFFALLQIETESLPWIWISAHALSRFLAISQLRFLEYVSDSADSKSSAMTDVSKVDLAVNLFFGFLPLLLIWNHVWMGIFSALLMRLLLMAYFRKKFGGVTGDCMGATQQLTEVVFYIFLGLKIGIW